MNTTFRLFVCYNVIMYEPIKNLIRELRLKKGLRQKDLAELIGVSETYVFLLENPNSKNLPSTKIIQKLAKALATSAEEEPVLYRKLLHAKAKSKLPREMHELIDATQTKAYIPANGMPEEFIERVKKDLQNYDLEEVAQKIGIDSAALKAVLLYNGILSKKEVIKLANTLNQSIYEYILLAGYIPENVKSLLAHNKAHILFRQLSEIPPDELDMLMDGIINILQAYRKKYPEKDDRRSNQS